jgi:outer membrane lipoprotein-sorting protein
MKRNCFFFLFLVWAIGVTGARAEELNPTVKSWLAAQTNIQTWSADFVQTRTLKSLAQPLTTSGHVWFAAPTRFHWELGNPPQTVAVRAPSELLIFYPRLRRVERFPLTGDQPGRWRDALALLEAGFPRSEAELVARYNILSQTVNGNVGELVLQPKSTSARRMLRQIKIDFDTRNSSLLGTELEFADGSTMRNDFKNEVLNPRLDEQLFNPPIPEGYKIVEPLKQQ